MSAVQEQVKALGSCNSSAILDEMRILGEVQGHPGARKVLHSELWHACAGPLVSLPQPGTLVYYFPQGHSEQVSASTRKTANSHIPNYPALPSQLLCQVHSVKLHADRDTDEIYAQMTLQPVNSEGDVFPIPDFGHTISKQPNEFFCKNLTASDTSTHGGFSVPRRAAEKLFPQLDYAMQPPNQELIVKDLHDNMWTFRHIYRGQPKRHLLTTGWSSFVGTKRLKAGDSVLFIRDEKSQLLLGVRRANRQQTTLPSSVLSTDSMHIGVLAAAAHAAASRTPFTVYYNPRACPSEFIIPLAKFHKAVYTQVSTGMRFGMMFETDESTKRRCMGTITGINDFDPLRWPNSKWRNVQVEWDEHGYGERPDRVSMWEIETPDSLFVFPTPSLKRQCLPGFVVPGAEFGFGSQMLGNGTGEMRPVMSCVGSEQLLKVLLTPQNPTPDNQLRCHQSIYASILQKIRGNGNFGTISPSPTFGAISSPLQQEAIETKPQSISSEAQKYKFSIEEQVIDLDCASKVHVEKLKEKLTADTILEKGSRGKNKMYRRNNQQSECESSSVQVEPTDKHNEVVVGPSSIVVDEELPLEQLEATAVQAHSLDNDNLNNLSKLQNNLSSQTLDQNDWMPQDFCYQSFVAPSKEPGNLSNFGIPDSSIFLLPSDIAHSPSADISSIVNPEIYNPFETFQFSSFSDPCTPQFLPTYIPEFYSTPNINPVHEEQITDLQKISDSCVMKDISDESISQSRSHSNLHFEATKGNMMTSSCVSSTVLEGFSTARDSSFCVPSEDLFSSFTCNQDLQSQVSSGNLAESLQEIPDGSGGTSSGSIDANECNLILSSMKQVAQPPLRTYTKVQKLGSVGRSIDVTRFKDYVELKSAIARMFGLEGQLDNPKGSEWKLVYLDYENDVLLVGDDPWGEFVKCVRCVRILSPSEVQQMSEEGIQLMNNHLPPCH